MYRHLTTDGEHIDDGDPPCTMLYLLNSGISKTGVNLI